MKKLLFIALILCAPHTHAMQMGDAVPHRISKKSNTCCTTLQKCCYLGVALCLMTAGQPVEAADLCEEYQKKTTECTAINADPCMWNSQYQSIHWCRFTLDENDQKPLDVSYIWDNRLGHSLGRRDCDDNTRKGSIMQVLSGTYERRRRLRIRECQDLYEQEETDKTENHNIVERLLAQEAIVFSPADGKIFHEIADRNTKRMKCKNEYIYPKQERTKEKKD